MTEKKEKSKVQFWGEIAAWVVIIFLVVAALRLGLRQDYAGEHSSEYIVIGGYENILEKGVCYRGDDLFIGFPVVLFAQGPDAQYDLVEVVNGENVSVTLELSDWLLYRFYNKELDRAVDAQGLVPGDNLTCSLSTIAEYSLSVPDGEGMSGVWTGSEEFVCTAPDGVHYQCAFDEKFHLWQLFNRMKSGSINFLEGNNYGK